MPQPFTKLTPHLWVTQSQYARTNSGIFLSEGQACLVDPGVLLVEIEAIAHFVAEREAMPRAIILTSSHRDHILGPVHFPGVQVIAQAQYAAEVRAHGDGIQRWIAEYYDTQYNDNFQRKRPFVIPQPDVTFEETMTLTVGDTALRLVHAPGHGPDLSVVYHPASATLWAADMLSDWIIPFVLGNLSAYQRTLDTISSWEIRVLIPGHGEPTTGPRQIRTILSQDIAYLSELRERVSQAVAQGKTLEETTAACANMHLRNPDDMNNNWAHPKNVGQVYLELGGDADPAQVGWRSTLEGGY